MDPQRNPNGPASPTIGGENYSAPPVRVTKTTLTNIRKHTKFIRKTSETYETSKTNKNFPTATSTAANLCRHNSRRRLHGEATAPPDEATAQTKNFGPQLPPCFFLFVGYTGRCSTNCIETSSEGSRRTREQRPDSEAWQGSVSSQQGGAHKTMHRIQLN